MEKFTKIKAVVAPLDRSNVDTDQIIPKQFLKRIERTGFGEFLFYDWRFLEDGKTLNPDFEMNMERYKGSGVLIAKDNFGSGSSREHAPWAIREFGFRVVIAPSFADIFYNNCFKNSILPVKLNREQVDSLFETVRANPGFSLEVDLEKQSITGSGINFEFDIDPFRKRTLLEGLDDISQTLKESDLIEKYEKKHVETRPWGFPAMER
ncbi:MAG: 3-isopropylmalate dehydratase small subunit [Candidatus Mycalebacterium zealandia]|nr:MAG: 3-isopropylmalate dehydratase small subunit [Candidatus Mycalebacterium zealandia]